MSSCDDRLTGWRELLNDQPKSGLSVKGWCESEGISTNTYYYWRKRLSEQPSRTETGSPQWLAITPSESRPARPGLTLRVGKVSIDLGGCFDRDLLRDVLDVLEARGC